MRRTAILTIALMLTALCGTAIAGGPNHPDEPPTSQNRHARHHIYMEPNPIRMCESVKILTFRFRGIDFNIDEVDLETVKVFGTIPPYTGPVRREGDWLVTDCFIFRFLRASGFVPWPGDFTATYTLEFDLLSGQHIVLEDEFSFIDRLNGDLNSDCVVSLEDIVVLSDCLSWDLCREYYSQADIDGDGDVDQDDLEALTCIVYGGC